MDAIEFAQKVREFPFLREILAAQHLSAESLGGIRVERGDRNLLEITPRASCEDAGTLGEHTDYRHFWFVGEERVVQLQSSWHRSIVPHGTRGTGSAETVGKQITALDSEVLFVVEIYANYWDYDEAQDKAPNVLIYKQDSRFKRAMDCAEKRLYVRAGYPAGLFEE